MPRPTTPPDQPTLLPDNPIQARDHQTPVFDLFDTVPHATIHVVRTLRDKIPTRLHQELSLLHSTTTHARNLVNMQHRGQVTHEGQQVRFKHGPFKDLTATTALDNTFFPDFARIPLSQRREISQNNQTIVVWLHSLGQLVALNVPRDNLEVIPPS